MFPLKKHLDKDEHEEIMGRLDEHEEELQGLAERVRELELEAELYKRTGHLEKAS